MRRLQPLSEFQIDPERGFLPTVDPIPHLPPSFSQWEDLAAQLSAYLISGRFRSAVSKLAILDTDLLDSEPQLQRAMLLLSVFGNAYVWGEADAADRVPAQISVPWAKISVI